MEQAKLIPTKRYICCICDDAGADWYDPGFDSAEDARRFGRVYHKSCVEYRIRHADNLREVGGMSNTLKLGHAI